MSTNSDPATVPADAPLQSQLPSQPKRRKLILLIAVAVIVALGAALTVVLLQKPSGPGSPAGQASAAEKLLYETLGNAAAQPVLRLGQYRATFADRAAADAGKSPASEASTISEISVPTKDYRTLYAYRLVGETKFTLGRCLTGQDYRDSRPLAEQPATLPAAAQTLNRIVPVSSGLAFSPCPQLGLYPGGSPDHAAARLSDGIFPVTLTKAQSANWVAKMQAADLFDVTDAGTVTKDGRALRKLEFKPKPGATKVNKQLYNIFYAAAEIDKIKAMNNPNARYMYEFISVGVVNHGDVAGFYLIDEATKLPVYSELKGLAEDRQITEPGDSAGNNIARTKQNYSFGGPLKLSPTSTLDFAQ